FSVGEGKSNSVAPYKKPLSSMSPTIVLKDGEPYAVIGSPGANRIIGGVAQVVSNLIDHGMTLLDAVAAPRIYNDTENVFKYEPRFDNAVIEALENEGELCRAVKPLDRYMGGINAICLGQDGIMTGVADPRRNGVSICCESTVSQ
ncbi:MAG: gamma-glutamyltransferase, partial [Oscillospiraceae bacterium]|nr:gamma-glutamyltransferase [Oscillospiraceae bacterium]